MHCWHNSVSQKECCLNFVPNLSKSKKLIENSPNKWQMQSTCLLCISVPQKSTESSVLTQIEQWCCDFLAQKWAPSAKRIAPRSIDEFLCAEVVMLRNSTENWVLWQKTDINYQKQKKLQQRWHTEMFCAVLSSFVETFCFIRQATLLVRSCPPLWFWNNCRESRLYSPWRNGTEKDIDWRLAEQIFEMRGDKAEKVDCRWSTWKQRNEIRKPWWALCVIVTKSVNRDSFVTKLCTKHTLMRELKFGASGFDRIIFQLSFESAFYHCTQQRAFMTMLTKCVCVFFLLNLWRIQVLLIQGGPEGGQSHQLSQKRKSVQSWTVYIVQSKIMKLNCFLFPSGGGTQRTTRANVLQMVTASKFMHCFSCNTTRNLILLRCKKRKTLSG